MPPENDQFDFSWSVPYKPQSTPGPSQPRDTFRRPSLPSQISPKSRTVSAAELPPPPDTNFQFPTRSYLPPDIRPPWPSLFITRLLPMSDPATVSEAEKTQMIISLRNHSVNTLAELRRIERVLAAIGTPDVSEPMTTAWQYYVNSHMLLTELRSLTKNYPFNSDCLDEAKRRVLTDPNSNRSWNYGWLVLQKIQDDALIPAYAQYQASLPAMWGNQIPSPEGVHALTAAFVQEWTWAVDQMLQHWEAAPVGQDPQS